jgi:histidine ammonia-lyase
MIELIHSDTEMLCSAEPLILGINWTIEDVIAVSRRQRAIQVSDDPVWCRHIQQSSELLEAMWRDGKTIYGVNTGYGDSCDQEIPDDLIAELPVQLTRFHGCGMGRHFTPDIGRAIVAVRACSLCSGFSGVRLDIIQGLADLLNADIIPLIPEEGSVGASGDLTPLSYVAAVLLGEREVFWRGQICSAAEALSQTGLCPLILQPKEALAIMNGTAVMTALACAAYHRARYLMRLVSRITALATEALCCNRQHFSSQLFEAKPFPGQAQIAAWIRSDLATTRQIALPQRFQAHYSIRCAPHIIGVLADALPWMKSHIEIELNSANDNPLIDIHARQVLHGGNFYGGHIAFVMDAMKNAVANLADLMDRQLALLVDRRFNNGLPANLVGMIGAKFSLQHGFKAVQIACSAWTAEALKLTMPASVFSRSTECHNQDKVSMGTIAARDGLRILELCEQVAAALLLAANQAISLRQQQGELNECDLPLHIRDFLTTIRELSPLLKEDRPLEGDLRCLVAAIQQQRWTFDDLVTL